MKPEAVTALISEIEALRGNLKVIQDRLWVVERVVLSNPGLAMLYQQKLSDREQDPLSMLPLTNLANLEKALRQDQS